jgi:TLC ATP/ADP transporter
MRYLSISIHTDFCQLLRTEWHRFGLALTPTLPTLHSGGALAQQVLVLLCGSITTGAPVLAVLFYMTIFAWIGEISSNCHCYFRAVAKGEENVLYWQT